MALAKSLDKPRRVRRHYREQQAAGGLGVIEQVANLLRNSVGKRKSKSISRQSVPGLGTPRPTPDAETLMW